MTDVLNFLILTFQGLYSIFADLLGYGWGLIALSLLSSFLFSPLEKWASRLKNDEVAIQKVLQPQLQKIKETLSGQEAWSATQRLYNRYSYHPLMAIRTAAFPLLQLPVLFLAYVALSSMPLLKGVSFGHMADLSQPDDLLFNLALLPFLMTGINIAITFVGSFTKRERFQAIIIALFFLVILYPAPAALLIYWTTNNFIGLIKALYQNLGKDEICVNCINKIKNAPEWVWSLPLCPLVPTLFLWANNVSYYPIKSIVASFGFVLFCSCFCWGILYKISKAKFNISRKLIIVFYGLYSIFIGFIFCSLSFSTLHAIFSDYRFYFILVFPISVVIFTTIFSFKTLNYIFGLQIIISMTLFCFNYGEDKKISNFMNPESISIHLKQKPNIYYFLCESYQNLNYIKKTFGYDSSDFISFLMRKNYTIYDNIYSNSSYTLGTLTNIFTMSIQTSDSTSLDASSKERAIIGGGKGNKLFEILKANGYETSFYLKGDKYFFSHKGELLDHTDVLKTWEDLLWPIKSTNGLLGKLINTVFVKLEISSIATEQDSLTILKNHLITSKYSIRPQFFAHKLGHTNHTDQSHTYKKRQDYINSQTYQSALSIQNKEIQSIIELLEKKDPNAIVIFLGDHGVWTLRGFSVNQSLENLKRELKQNNFTLQDIIDDQYYVFAAIKTPNNIKPLRLFSPNNIFPQLFLELSNQENDHYNEQCIKLGKNILCLEDNAWIIK